jgi:ribokinase
MRLINQVLVVGSANVDVSVTVPVLPRPGETLMGTGSVISVGGKGANQAVAAAACGAGTELIARIGADAFGGMVREALAGRGVGHGRTLALPDAGTGLAAIYVGESGQNCIVVVPGANARLTPADIEAEVSLIRECDSVVLQCEIPMDTLYRTVELAAACGKTVILNPAPFQRLDVPRLVHGVTYLVPNETEAAQLCGTAVTTSTEAGRSALWLRDRGFPCVILTLGAQGCVVADERGVRHFPAHPVTAIDATGAGDAFVGCLAASLAGGWSRDDALRRAVVYSALSTTRRGAQVSYAGREEFESVWREMAAAG